MRSIRLSNLSSGRTSGFSILEMVVVLGIIGAVAVGLSQLLTSGLKIQNRANLTAKLDELRRNLSAAVSHEKGWEFTLNDSANTGLSCLRSHQPCTIDGTVSGTPISNSVFRVRDAQNQLIYDPLVSTSGFTSEGALCNEFNLADGNDRCPLRYDISWTAVCTSPCTDPQIKIIGTLKYAPNPQTRSLAMNSTNYDFTVLRSVAGSVGSGAGWVSIAACSPAVCPFGGGGMGGILCGNGVWCNLTPDDTCQSAGFSVATGACKLVGGAYGSLSAGGTFNGAGTAGPSPGNPWVYLCQRGTNSGLAPVSILCAK